MDDTPVMDEDGTEITPQNADIIFENVNFSYSTRKILYHVGLSVPEKTTTAIVGPSGSVKTTMCNLIALFGNVNAGKITIGGINVRDFTLDSLMNNISMGFQNVYLFADTIENNIKFGCPDAFLFPRCRSSPDPFRFSQKFWTEERQMEKSPGGHG